jgi:hypothetical protein
MADDDKPPTGFPEPPGRDPGDRSHDEEPHHALTSPADAPDPEEAELEQEDLEADIGEAPEGDKLDQ